MYNASITADMHVCTSRLPAGSAPFRPVKKHYARHICNATSTQLSNKGWWKPKRLPVASGPETVPDCYPTRQAREALFGVGTEQVEAVEVTVDGQLPTWLSGSLLANGAGDYTGSNHMFDGYASIAKVEFQNGKAKASHRFLDTKAYRALKATGRPTFREFSSVVPAASPQERSQQTLAMVQALVLGQKDAVFTDNASVNVVPLQDGSVLAMSEAEPSQYRVDPSTLATQAQVRLAADGVSGDLQTAHPSSLPDGTLVNFSYAVPFGSYTVYTQDPKTLQRRKIASIPHRTPFKAGWMHDFAVSSKYAVLVEPPLYLNLGSIMAGTSTEHVMMDWVPDEPTRVHVVPLDGSGKVRTYTAPPLFVFHFGNAFESKDEKYLYVDFAAFDDPTIINDLLLANCRRDYPANVSAAGYRRLTIPLADGQESTGLYGDNRPELLIPPRPLVEDEGAHGFYAEFPAFNRSLQGKPYRYAYIMAAQRPTNLGNAVAKLDLQQRTSQLWHRPGWVIGEPNFIPAPNAQAEDEGVVAFFAASAEGQSRLVVLDAASWQQLAIVELPFDVPQRFHACFVRNQ